MAESFKNLKVWQEAIILAEFLYQLTKKFPKDEVFGIVSQIRRAVVSVSSNIAEGSSRNSKRDFSRFIDIAIGSLHEVESLMCVSVRLKYLSQKDFDTVQNKVATLGLGLGGFRKYLNK